MIASRKGAERNLVTRLEEDLLGLLRRFIQRIDGWHSPTRETKKGTGVARVVLVAIGTGGLMGTTQTQLPPRPTRKEALQGKATSSPARITLPGETLCAPRRDRLRGSVSVQRVQRQQIDSLLHHPGFDAATLPADRLVLAF